MFKISTAFNILNEKREIFVIHVVILKREAESIKPNTIAVSDYYNVIRITLEAL